MSDSADDSTRVIEHVPAPAPSSSPSSSQSMLRGRYQLIRRIGRGGTADVWLAHDTRLRRDVAIKMFHADVPSGSGTSRIESEMHTLAALRHPGLVSVFDAGLAADPLDNLGPVTPAGTDHAPDDAVSASPYLVMELIDGVSLRHRLADGPLTAPETLAIGRCVAATLDYVHRTGVVHRDVKPANILLDRHPSDPRYTAKLADFGIARLADATHVTAVGTTVGTANYLSPEQVLGSDVGPASDIYSLGLVLLECLTGTMAFPGTGVESAAARLHRDPEVPGHLDPGWAALLTAMTARDADARPDAAQVAEALERISSGAPVPTDAVTVAQAAPPPLDPPAAAAPTPGADATRVLPGLAEPGNPFGPPSAPAPGTARPPHDRGRRKAIALAIAALGVVVLILVVVLVANGGGGGTGPSTPTYPQVPGQLGTHLRHLESVIG